jgi:iron-sulfur cluster repair protein YtfE (RIC family)
MTGHGSESRGADTGLVAYFTQGHRGCDGGWAEVEAAADADDDDAVRTGWLNFERAFRRHLAMEEALLFPAVEAATGMADAGPTRVMRMEHEQMRAVLDQMAAAMERGDRDELLDQGDTLHILIQQHNVKEEGVLYPLAERALDAQWPELREKLDRFEIG